MKTVFINYSWDHHTEQALQLYDAFTTLDGFTPWIDRKNIPAGLEWRSELKKYCQMAKCAYEEGIVLLLAGQLVSHFVKIGFHDKTKNCVMDFCEDRSDLVYGLIRRNFCTACFDEFPDNALKTAILQLLNWRYRAVPQS